MTKEVNSDQIERTSPAMLRNLYLKAMGKHENDLSLEVPCSHLNLKQRGAKGWGCLD